mmetsp:Transcript_92783/g.300087  ORF Transcript_92783/g.300087 Transcript_92783/m.300087 type:complete len:341 (-) Transcript_92783:211-1233(-)
MAGVHGLPLRVSPSAAAGRGPGHQSCAVQAAARRRRVRRQPGAGEPGLRAAHRGLRQPRLQHRAGRPAVDREAIHGPRLPAPRGRGHRSRGRAGGRGRHRPAGPPLEQPGPRHGAPAGPHAHRGRHAPGRLASARGRGRRPRGAASAARAGGVRGRADAVADGRQDDGRGCPQARVVAAGAPGLGGHPLGDLGSQVSLGAAPAAGGPRPWRLQALERAGAPGPREAHRLRARGAELPRLRPDEGLPHGGEPLGVVHAALPPRLRAAGRRPAVRRRRDGPGRRDPDLRAADLAGGGSVLPGLAAVQAGRASKMARTGRRPLGQVPGDTGQAVVSGWLATRS